MPDSLNFILVAPDVAVVFIFKAAPELLPLSMSISPVTSTPELVVSSFAPVSYTHLTLPTICSV